MREGLILQIQHLISANPNNQVYPALLENALTINRYIDAFWEKFSFEESWVSEKNAKELSEFGEKFSTMQQVVTTMMSNLKKDDPCFTICELFNKDLQVHINEIIMTVAIINTQNGEATLKKMKKLPEQPITDIGELAKKDILNAWEIFNTPAKAVQVPLHDFRVILARFQDVGLRSIYGYHLASLMCMELEKRVLAIVYKKDLSCFLMVAEKGVYSIEYKNEIADRADKGVIPCSLKVTEKDDYDRIKQKSFKKLELTLELDNTFQKPLDDFFASLEKKFPDLYNMYHHVLYKRMMMADINHLWRDYREKNNALQERLQAARKQLAQFHKIVALINPATGTQFLESTLTFTRSEKALPDVRAPGLLQSMAEHEQLLDNVKRAEKVLQLLDDNLAIHPDGPDAKAWLLTKKHLDDCRGSNKTLVSDIYSNIQRGSGMATFASSVGRTLFGRLLPPPIQYAETQEAVAEALDMH